MCDEYRMYLRLICIGGEVRRLGKVETLFWRLEWLLFEDQ